MTTTTTTFGLSATAADAPPVRRPGYLLMVAVVTTLCLVGLVMVLSASSVASLRSFGTPWRYFERQGMYLGAGAVAFFAAQGIKISFWQRVARPMMFVAGARPVGGAGRRAQRRRGIAMAGERLVPVPAFGARQAGAGDLRR